LCYQTFDIVGKPLTIGFRGGDFIDFRLKVREILNLKLILIIENSTKSQRRVLEGESSLVMSSHLGQWHMPPTGYLLE
jgi:hypothetical protein